MKKKDIKVRVQEYLDQNKMPCIKVAIDDEYFVKCIDILKIKIPQSILDNSTIQMNEKRILFRPRSSQFQFIESDFRNIQGAFKNISAYHCANIQEDEQQFKKKVNALKGHEIIGFKKFHVNIHRFEKGDYLIYSKGKISQFINKLSNYINNQFLQYDLDQFLQTQSIPSKYYQKATEIVVSQLSQYIKPICNSLELKINKIRSRFNERSFRQKMPAYSICLDIEGNGLNIHILYLQIQQKLKYFHMNLIQIDEEIPIQNISNLQKVFPQFKNRIFSISPNAVITIEQSLQLQKIEEIKRRLKYKEWVLGIQTFNFDEIQILNSEYKNTSLKRYMDQRKIYLESIQFKTFQVIVVCDKAMIDRFVEHSRALLSSFVLEKQICYRYDTNFIIQIFKKYYYNNFKDKFNVEFQFGKDYMIRKNFTKYSDQIQEELKYVRQKIKKKITKIISRKGILNDSILNPIIYKQNNMPPGYDHSLLGCCFYKMGNVQIKMKNLQSLRRQQQCITFIIDDRVKDCSKFYKIVQISNINYESFLSEVHKVKKPDRLRQYLTQDSPYGLKTVLLHAGRQRVTQTIKRDLNNLFTILNQRLCAIIFQHQSGFLRDVFRLVLQEIRLQSQSAINNENSSASSIYKQPFQAEFYYQGGIEWLGKIQEIMRNFSSPINKISSFCLEEFDIEKIYALEYYSMDLIIGKQFENISPIIPQLLDYELNRSIRKSAITRDDKKKKFIFSKLQQVKHQLVQFVISTKSEVYHKITHDEGVSNWTNRPCIQKIEQLDQFLVKTIAVIKKYLNRTDYIVFCADSISDGLHGRQIKYCTDFFMVEEESNQVHPIQIDLEQKKIHKRLDLQKHQYKIRKNKISQWYQINTYKDELESINQLLQKA